MSAAPGSSKRSTKVPTPQSTRAAVRPCHSVHNYCSSVAGLPSIKAAVLAGPTSVRPGCAAQMSDDDSDDELFSYQPLRPAAAPAPTSRPSRAGASEPGPICIDDDDDDGADEALHSNLKTSLQRKSKRRRVRSLR